MPGHSEMLLQAILSTVARQTFSEEKIGEIVLPRNAGAKQLKAYNLCDGTMTQGEIAKKVKMDAGNFSRTVARWVDLGILFRLGEGREAKLLHVYSVSKENAPKRGAGK